MSLLETIELRKDQLRMEREKQAIEKRDKKIAEVTAMLANGEISQELADKWIRRAKDEYERPEGGFLSKVGDVLKERIQIAGENIAADQKRNADGDFWGNLGENFRNMKQDDFTLNIPEQGGIDLSKIPQTEMDLSKIPQNQINFDGAGGRPQKKSKKGKVKIIERHYYHK